MADIEITVRFPIDLLARLDAISDIIIEVGEADSTSSAINAAINAATREWCDRFDEGLADIIGSGE